ncbi:MAG: HipA family kinase [Enhygromyxa sp.]
MRSFDTRREFEAALDLDLTRVRGQARWRSLDRGGAWFYKRMTAVPSVTRWPSPWSELLCSELLRRLGLPHLEASLLYIREGHQWIVRLPAVERVMPSAVVASRAPLPVADDEVLLDAGLWRLFLFDLLVGNGDRSFANLFVTPAPARFLPIDHELALLTPSAIRPECAYFHFVPPGHPECPESDSAHRRALLRLRGTTAAIAEANRAYRRLRSAARMLQEPVAAWIELAQSRLTENWFRECVSRVPDELFPGDSAEDREYLCSTMKARVAGLPELIAA